MTTAKILESLVDEERVEIPVETYYELLNKNKTAFFYSTAEEIVTFKHSSRDIYHRLFRELKAMQSHSKQLTEDQEEYLQRVIT